MTFAVFTSTATTSDYAWDAMTNICARIDAHPGWEFVEMFASASTQRVYVVKCLAASSGLPNDFYVLFLVNSGAVSVSWIISEEYELATHSVRRAFMYIGVNAQYLTTADGSLSGDTWTVVPNGTLANNGNSLALHWKPFIESGFGPAQEFVLSVQNDCLLIMPRGQSPFWAGKFTSLVDNAAVNDPMPIYQPLRLSSDWQSYYGEVAGTARQPLRPNTTMRHPGLITAPTQQSFSTWQDMMYPGHTGGNTGDLFHGGKAPMWALPLISYNESAPGSNSASHGFLRGKIESVRHCSLPTGVGGYLDEMNVDGQPWVYLAASLWVSVTA